jgi:type II secretory pathway pseudopilin PulG
VRAVAEQVGKKTAFTIVELLTVMSVIVIVIGLLVPSLNMVKRYAKEVKQQTQFHSIGTALELFSNDWGDYPPSDALDEDNAPYCGAMKLCEAMVGQDLMGFHPNSRFRRNRRDGAGNELYASSTFTPDSNNLKLRKTYLQLERANPCEIRYLYGPVGLGWDRLFVLCDEYSGVINLNTGKKTGMPILYYKADTSNTVHDVNDPSNSENIYDYLDNDRLVQLGPGSVTHPLGDTTTNFYEITRDKKIDSVSRPVRPDSYILISAGFDGIYGTKDDITNF